MSTDTTSFKTEIRGDRRTTAQLLKAAARDTDAVSVFHNGTGPDDFDGAIFVVKGRSNVDYLKALCERQGLLTQGKPVEA